MWNVKNFARHDANILNPRLSKWNTESGDNIVRLEFPILQWFIGMQYKLFGERIIIMRCIMMVIGLFGVLALFQIIHFETKNMLAASLTAGLVQFSPLFYYYIINPLPDLLALSMGFWYIYFIRRYRHEGRFKLLILACSFLMISTLAKLPFLMFSIISVYYFLTDLFKKTERNKAIKDASLILLFLVIPVCWYSWVMPSWGTSGVLTGVFEHGLFTAENKAIFFAHMKSIFPHRLFSWPLYPLILMGFIYIITNIKKSLWVWSLIFIVLSYFILELSTINIYHDYYLLPLIPPFYILIGLGVNYALDIAKSNWIVILAVIALSALYCKNQIDNDWSIEKSYTNPDFFNHAEDLKKAAPRDVQCIIMRDLSGSVLSNQIDKQGHIFDSDTFPMGWVKDMILTKNVKYMYSDSEEMNSHMESSEYLDTLVMTRGSVNVYKLKSSVEVDLLQLNQ